MNKSKRFFDVLLATLLGLLTWPLMILVAIYILLLDGHPILYKSPRMKTPTQSFYLLKFRTMTPQENDSGPTCAGKLHRITRSGKFLRQTRLDELPQIWNVLKGDVSFVGPRPPDYEHVQKNPEIYEKVLRSRPGITGLATLYSYDWEDRIFLKMNNIKTALDTHNDLCIPRKARLDLIYQKHQSICFDVYLIYRTILKLLFR